MKGMEIFYWIFLLIMAFLLINKSSDTTTVVKGIGGQATNLIQVLQGQQITNTGS